MRSSRPPQAPAERGALPAIFAVFLGLMIAAVVGLGVYTFMPSPRDAVQEQLDELYEQRDELIGCNAPDYKCVPPDELTTAEQQRYDQLDDEIEALQDRADDQQDSWAQRTSIVLIVLATALMALSLLLTESMAVLSNGILLGGLFTMLYGVGWAFASDRASTRFGVLVVALLISIGLGYLRFVRPRTAAPPPGPPVGGAPPGAAPADASPVVDSTGPRSAELGELAARVSELERRLVAVAHLLGPPRDGGGP